jgi:hypothetical protein
MFNHSFHAARIADGAASPFSPEKSRFRIDTGPDALLYSVLS